MVTPQKYYLNKLCFYGFILELLLPLGDTQSGCGQAGWIRWADGDSCYYKSQFGTVYDKTRDEAQQACNNLGGQLTSIVDQLEWQFIKDNVIMEDILHQYWIGLQRKTGFAPTQTAVADRPNWQWQDQMPYSNSWNKWFDGANPEPSGEAPCARIFGGGFWADTFCINRYRYICKIRNPSGYTRKSTTTIPSTPTTTTIPSTPRRTTKYFVLPTASTKALTAPPTSATIPTKTSILPVVSKLVTGTNPPPTSTISVTKVNSILPSKLQSVVPSYFVSNRPSPQPSFVPSKISSIAPTTTTKSRTTSRFTTTPTTTTTKRVTSIRNTESTTTADSAPQASAYTGGLNLPVIIGVTIGAVALMAGTIALGAFLLWRRKKKGPEEDPSSLAVEETGDTFGDTHRAFYVGERVTKDIQPLPTWPEEDEEAAARDSSVGHSSRVSGFVDRINSLKSREFDYYGDSAADDHITDAATLYATVSKGHAI